MKAAPPPTAQNPKSQSQPASQTSNRGNRKSRGQKKAPTTIQPVAASSTSPTKEQKRILNNDLKESSPSGFLYVVQAAETSEQVIGIYSSLERAKQSLLAHAAKQNISPTDITDITSGLGCGERKSYSVTRRVWPDGRTEVRVNAFHKLKWIKILPKEFPALAQEGGPCEPAVVERYSAYLALDRSGAELFVIGAGRAKGEAWEACLKYSTQLSCCSEIQNREQWVDGQGMFHVRGAVGGRAHHWYVERYAIDATI